jgi:periplasmic copper chaperone A
MPQPDRPPAAPGGLAPEHRRWTRPAWLLPGLRLPARQRPARRRPAAVRAAAAACVLVAGGGALAGCAAKAAAAASIQAGNGYVVVPASGGTTEAFLVIRNNGAADRLTSVRTSAGGQVVFRVPARPGATTMRTVTGIPIPAHSTVRFSPDSPHLLIRDSRPIKGGTQLTLTLVFARGGTMSVVAVVTNPASGGSSYFIN